MDSMEEKLQVQPYTPAVLYARSRAAMMCTIFGRITWTYRNTDGNKTTVRLHNESETTDLRANTSHGVSMAGGIEPQESMHNLNSTGNKT